MEVAIITKVKKAASSNKEAAGVTLYELFEKYGYSAAEVAKIMETSEDVVKDWADGTTPDTMTCIKLARSLGCSLKTVYLAIISTPLQNN